MTECGKIEAKKVEQIIYDWVVNNFGKSEAEDPSWNPEALSTYVADSLNAKNYVGKHDIVYIDQ